MTRTLTRLLHPRSIAFIGGRECEVAIAQTQALGFAGEIFAVHPQRPNLAGIACLRTVADLPSAPDAAFIAVKREPAIEIVRQLRTLGCGGAVIYASGFAETGDRHLQDALLAAADGMPLLGPNCYGFVNGLARAALWPDEHGLDPCERGVAMVTQSGNIACNFTMTRRGLPVAGVFAIGNQASVDMAEMLNALSADKRITAIGLHIEGLPDCAAFAEAAALARTRRKPVIALKTGRSEQGAKVALSHTSSLAGADALYDALFERYGIARVGSITAFAETLKLLHHGGPLAGNRLVSMSCSGGEAALVADLALTREVCFPPFDPGTAQAVAATLNEYVSIGNPLDYHTFIWNQPAKLTATFSAVLNGGFDAGLLILDIPTHPRMNPASWRLAAQSLHAAAVATGARAAVVASLPECMPLDLAAELSAAGVAPMMGLEDALIAFEAAARIGENWARQDEPAKLAPAAAADGAIVTLSETEAKVLLARYGLVVPAGEVCKPEDAPDIAARIGFPVTLKVSSAAIAHKTEANGVVLNLRHRAEVQTAAAGLAALTPEILVEQMVTGAVAELIIGLIRDPQFGLALVIGAGGVFTELLEDSITLLLPTTREEIARALPRLKVWRVVTGFRGRSGDAPAVLAAIAAVARFAAAQAGEIEEAEINPLLVLPDGAVAVDAFIRLRRI